MTVRAMSVLWERIRIYILRTVYNICVWFIELLSLYIVYAEQTKPFQDWWLYERSAIIIVLCIRDIVIIQYGYVALPRHAGRTLNSHPHNAAWSNPNDYNLICTHGWCCKIIQHTNLYVNHRLGTLYFNKRGKKLTFPV
jgi:hypothetical protein